jgi:hypothetical protein
MKPFTSFLITVLILLSSTASADPAKAACELLESKYTNFGGLELIRACSILAEPPAPFPNLCPLVCAGEPSPCDIPQEPLVDLVAENMLYFNWEIPEQNVAAIEDSLGLEAKGFHIVPIEIIKGEKPKYYLSLNFYSVDIAGDVTYRSEWSVYVAKGGDPKPRYMVVEILSSEDAADPTYWPLEIPPNSWFLRPGTEVSYAMLDGQVEVSNPDFMASFSLHPGLGDRNKSPVASGKTVKVGQTWVEANDALYYENGIADTALYNGNLTDARLLAINPNKVQISSNSSFWSAFVGEKPDNVLLYMEPLKLAFTPYFNLSDSLRLPGFYTGALQIFKNFTFGIFSHGHALQVLGGQAEPLVRFNVLDDRVPSIFINFNIPRNKVRGLESQLALPSGFRLARSRMTNGRPAQYLLSLNIYETINVLTGQRENRAEWSVYVEDGNDPTASGSYLMVIDVDSNAPSLNPYDGPTPPTQFDYDNQAGILSADIKTDLWGQFDKFLIEFDMPSTDAPVVSLRRDWILSNDRVYWRNGIHDLLLYNGLLLDADVVEVDPKLAAIDDNTIWAEFVDETPVQIAVFRTPLQFVIRPWYNAEELCFGQ